MSYLLDTNVLSEGFRTKVNPNVREWLKNTPSRRLFMSVLTIGEIQKGLFAMPAGRRRQLVQDWLKEEVEGAGLQQWLPVDERCALQWGRLVAGAGRTLPAIDSLIAATALAHDLTLLTRNVKDFEFENLRVLNPWETPPS